MEDTRDRKNIPIEREIHKALKIYSAETGISMKDLVEGYIKIILEGGDRREAPNAVSPSR